MNKDNNSFSKGSYPNHQKTIKGINFTSRELDILACMVSGRRIKTIAGFLSIAPKTVETHIRNIMLKLECNSQESIISFIEKSGKLAEIKQHYLNILTTDLFAQSLKEVAPLISKAVAASVTIHAEEGEQVRVFVHKLAEHLKKVGIATTTQFRHPHEIAQEKEKGQKDNVLYIVSENAFNQFKAYNQKDSKNTSEAKGAEDTLAKSTFLLVGKAIKDRILNTPKELSCVDFREHKNYYFSFFELLIRIFPTVKLESVFASFKQQYEAIQGSTGVIQGSTGVIHPQVGLEKNRLTKEIASLSNKILDKLSKKRKILKTTIICFGMFVILCAIFIDNKISNYTQQNKTPEIKSIRSDLPLPTEPNLLQRPELIEKIKEKLNGNKGIQTVALVGIGGAGKTIIARQYAHAQKALVVWEINAETNGSLINSFESLACRLAKTEEEKKTLKEIQEIKNSKEREEKVVVFVKERLYLYPNWLLIYDSVEKFTDIQQYLPSDSTVWGPGRVIITTRDSNIQNNSLVNHSIQIGELDQKQKLDLFIKILFSGNNCLYTCVQKEEVKKFLKGIPPFPLDISIAGYYIKATNVSYKKYLDNLSNNEEYFIDTQEKIMKESSNYAKNRYKIITLSLKHLIEVDKDFGDLLLFISLLDSQNIPRELLNKFKNDVTVENFIYHLKKYSLVTGESLSSSYFSNFSIHKSTNAIILDYLTKVLNLGKNQELIQSIGIILENHMDNVIDKEDLSEMKFFTSHCEMFLSHNKLIPSTTRAVIKDELGYIFYHLRDDLKAKEFLEESLKKINKHDRKNFDQIVQILVYLANINMELGNNDKAKALLDNVFLDYQEYFSKNHVGVARALAFIGDIYVYLGEYKKAMKVLEHSLRIYKKHSEDRVGFARILGYIGNLYGRLGKYKKAKETLEQSLVIYKKHFPNSHIGFAWVFLNLGNIHENLGEYEKAKDLLEQAVKLYEENFSENHADTAWSLGYLGNTYINLKNYEKAKKIIEKSLKIHKMLFQEDNIRTLEPLFYLGNLYNYQGNLEQAKNLFEKILIIFEKTYGKNHFIIARILRSLGQTYYLQNKMSIAENMLQKALDISQQNECPESYLILEDLAEIYLKKCEYEVNVGHLAESKRLKEQATNCLIQALEITKIYFPENSPHIKRIYSKLKGFSFSPVAQLLN